MTETADINKTLADDGWAITPVLVNPGDHKTASAWQIVSSTLTRNWRTTHATLTYAVDNR